VIVKVRVKRGLSGIEMKRVGDWWWNGWCGSLVEALRYDYKGLRVVKRRNGNVDGGRGSCGIEVGIKGRCNLIK